MATPVKKVKLQLAAGAATAAPPVGTVLGPTGINIGQFVQQFNAATQEKKGSIIPAELTIYDDRSFTFVLKTSPAPRLILKAAGLEKGSGNTPKTKAGSITKAQVAEIAKEKAPDLNSNSQEAAERLIAGTARSMGIDVK